MSSYIPINCILKAGWEVHPNYIAFEGTWFGVLLILRCAVKTQADGAVLTAQSFLDWGHFRQLFGGFGFIVGWGHGK